MEEHVKVDLRGSIVRIDEMLVSAQKEYLEVCSMVAANQTVVMEKLLELAPQDLYKALRPAMFPLFQYRQASFHLKGWNAMHAATKAAMLNSLSRAWKDVVEVDVEINQGRRTHFTVHLRAIK